MSKALSEASPLKPEIRLAQAISEFATILPDNQRVVFKALQRTSRPSPSDIIRVTEEINHDGARQHSGWRQYGTRLVGILDRIQLFSNVGDILVGGSQNMIASGIWAVVRLSLRVATEFLSFFDRVSDFFMRIGKSSSIQKELVLLFPYCRELQQLMCEYLIVLVHVCRQVVLYTKKGTLYLFATSLVVSFDKEFKSFEDGLDRWVTLINRRVSLLSTKSQLRNQSLVLLSSSQSERRLEEERRFRILQILSPYQASFDFAWRRERKKGTVKWVFEDQSYKAWETHTSSSTLWIAGKIGSGKSVLMANIVGRLCAADYLTTEKSSAREGPLVGSFFCHHSNLNSLKARNIVGSVAHQFLRGLPAMDDVTSKTCCDSLESLSMADTDDIIEFIQQVLPAKRQYYIILDALDECDGDQIEEALAALQQLCNGRQIRICFSSRKESAATRIASNYFDIDYNISMSSDRRDTEIAEYIDSEISRRNKSGSVDAHLQSLIRNALTSKADGMYLWVALQIDALFPRYSDRIMSDSDMFKILDSLPRDLPEAFDRALERISDDRYGRTIFELVAVAERPLTAEELRVALNVEPGRLDWNPATLAHNALLLIGLCGGGLLEIEEEDDTVHFIHFSAVRHLLEPPGNSNHDRFHFDLKEADIKVGSLCVTYLSYATFKMQLSTTETMLVDVTGITEQISTSLFPPHTTAGKLMTAVLRNFTQTQQASEVNIGQAVEAYLRTRQQKDDIHCLLDFATKHWLGHTKLFFNDVASPSYRLFKTLLYGDLAHITKPWDDPLYRGALKWAMRHCHGSIFQLLLEDETHRDAVVDLVIGFIRAQPSEFTIQGEHMGGILVHCIDRGCLDTEVLRFLLDKGADPNLGCQSCLLISTPLTLAISTMNRLGRQDIDVLDMFLQAGADPRGSRGNCDSLLLAIETGWEECLEKLLIYLKPFKKDELLEPLALAVRHSRISVARALLQNGADPNAAYVDDEVAVQFAARADSDEMVLCLVENGASFDLQTTPEKEPLIQLILNNHSETASRILSRSTPVSKQTLNSALHCAVAASGSAAQALVLDILRVGAEADCTLTDCRTPLSKAILKNNHVAVSHLLSFGASYDVYFGPSLAPALSLACRRRYQDIAEQLIAAGSNPNLPCLDGYTPLHHAISSKDSHIVRKLLEAQADPNKVSSKGTLPIHQAIDLANPAIVGLLLNHKACVDIATVESNENPLTRACSHLQVAQMQEGRVNSLRQIIQLLAKEYRDVRGFETLFHSCSRYFDEATTLAFVTKGLDMQALCFLEDPEHHPLIIATRRAMYDVLQVIIEPSTQVIRDYALWTAILHVHKYRMAQFVNILLAYGADPNSDVPPWVIEKKRTSLLVTALSRAGDDITVALLKAGATVDIWEPTENGNPLLLAANYGRSESLLTIWELHVAGTTYEAVMEEQVRQVLGPWEGLTDEERWSQWALTPHDIDNEGKQIILAFLESKAIS